MASFYYLRGTKEKKKIYISVTSGTSFTVQKATKFVVHVDEWDQKNNKLIVTKGRLAAAKAELLEREKINAELLEYQNKVESYLHELKESDSLSEQRIVDFISALNGKKTKTLEIATDFNGFLEYYFTSKHWLADGTVKAYRRTGNLVNKLYPKLRMSDIDDSFKKNFAAYMKENEHQMSYIRKTLGNVRDFWKYAKDKGLTVSIDPQTWELGREFPTPKEQKYEDPYLSLAELDLIKAVNFEKESLDNARDWLLICCWTAQRVSDLMQFTPDKITEVNGEQFITIIQNKGKKEITIPLFNEVAKILNKRNGNFPRAISEQKFNEYIKEVCEKAGLTEIIHGSRRRQKTEINGRTVYRNQIGYFPKFQLISSHIGRRSFISNFLRQIDYEKIKQISGHSHSSMVQLYDKMGAITKAELLRADYKNAGIE